MCLRSPARVQNTSVDYTVLLSVSREPFLLDDGFPESAVHALRDAYGARLRIELVENYGSARKLVPALRLLPRDSLVITVDDDCVMPPNLVEAYVRAFRRHGCIIASKVQRWRPRDDPCLNSTRRPPPPPAAARPPWHAPREGAPQGCCRGSFDTLLIVLVLVV